MKEIKLKWHARYKKKRKREKKQQRMKDPTLWKSVHSILPGGLSSEIIFSNFVSIAWMAGQTFVLSHVPDSALCIVIMIKATLKQPANKCILRTHQKKTFVRLLNWLSFVCKWIYWLRFPVYKIMLKKKICANIFLPAATSTNQRLPNLLFTKIKLLSAFFPYTAACDK